MLALFRILGAAALAYFLYEAQENASTHPASGDLMNAFYVAVCVVLAIFNALIWAPFVGDRLSRSITSVVTDSTFVDKPNRFLKLIGWFEQRGFRRLTLFLCFLEGIRHPALPAAFMIGLNNAKPGSWLEKVYAREVFRFDNIQHCVKAFKALKRRGIDPRPHRNPEINIVLLSLQKEKLPPHPPIPMPVFDTQPALHRNSQIQLFENGVPGSPGPTSAPNPSPTTAPGQPGSAGANVSSSLSPDTVSGKPPAEEGAPDDSPWLRFWKRVWVFIQNH